MKLPNIKTAMPPVTNEPLESMAIQAPNAYRTGLKTTHRWNANRAASLARLEATKKVDAAAITASTDVMITAIEHRRGEQKAALASAAVVRYGAIAQELVARTGVTQEQLTAIQFEGFTRQIGQRKAFVDEAHRAVARGDLDAAELPFVIDEINAMIQSDNGRLAAASGRAKDAVDALAESATNHIVRLKDRL